ncbi:hypothetical protein EX30DRAFT_160504 [Ascodesmis nigricans]|uniref:Uncharacterized protein n=1 Tax=Ascodesmis nigricans TaxID=341454 RepID=A0A4S2MS74_9PEZI|nr:hypothetical protein EX30DRAFT_160504 [Ascodesmis nigricans]
MYNHCPTHLSQIRFISSLVQRSFTAISSHSAILLLRSSSLQSRFLSPIFDKSRHPPPAIPPSAIIPILLFTTLGAVHHNHPIADAPQRLIFSPHNLFCHRLPHSAKNSPRKTKAKTRKPKTQL